MKKGKFIAIALLVSAVGLMSYAGLGLFEAESVYREGNAAYDDLAELTREINPEPAPVPLPPPPPQERDNAETPPEAEAYIYIPGVEVDFEALRTVNKDTVAWLYCPDTVIDYPVMKADDYNYYLKHLPDGTPNANGSLFIDYNNACDFSDAVTVIYGHHMKSGRMFGGLKGYKSQEYYEQHPFMYLYTEQGNYRIDLMYGCVISAEQWRRQAFMFSENAQGLISYASENTTFTSGLTYEDGDRIVALSTCSYEFNDARYVVIGILKGAIK